MNNLRKTPVLQLKQSNLPLALYLLNEIFVREKHVLGHTCDGLDNWKSQKDTEANITEVCQKVVYS